MENDMMINNEKKLLIKYQQDSFEEIVTYLKLEDDIVVKIRQLKYLTAQLDYMLKAEEHELAVKLLALGLPSRETIWWAFIILNENFKDNTNSAIQTVLKHTQDWVRSPTDTKRLKVKDNASPLNLFMPITWLAEAVFTSGGSIAPKGTFDVLPDKFVSQLCAATAINLHLETLANQSHIIRRMLKSGLHIAMGGNGCITMSKNSK